MTAEATINSVLAQLKSLSTSYQTQAKSLVTQAGNDLKAIVTPTATPVDYNVTPNWNVAARPRTPFTTDPLTAFTLPGTQKLQVIDQETADFNLRPPSLHIPQVNRLDSLPLPEFTAATPTPDPLSIQPVVPVLTEPTPPTLTVPQAVTTEPVSGTAPDVPLPVFKAFTGDVHEEYLRGLSLMGGDLTGWTAWLSRLRSQLFPLETQLITRLRGVLAGPEPGLPETWETQSYQQGQHTVFAERYTELLKPESSSITGLPSGEGVYTRFQTELDTLQAVTQAAAKTTNDRQDREVKHLQWAMELLDRMVQTALDIKSQEATWRIKGLMLALEGAEATLDVVLQVLKFKERELDFFTRYNEAQVRRIETQITMEKSRLESVKLEVKNNELLVTHATHQAQAYQISGEIIQNRVKLYEAQIEYLAVDVAWRKLVFQAFEAEINAYRASAQAKVAEYRGLKAEIDRDKVQIDALVAEVQMYEATVAAEAAKAQGLITKAQAQIAANKSLIEQYNAAVRANSAYLDAFDDYTRLSVEAIGKNFSVEAAQKQIDIAQTELDHQALLNSAERTMELEAIDLMNVLKKHQAALKQAEAKSRIMNEGADTFSSISTTAAAGLNAVAITGFEESM
jgi:hypothetical protein